MKTAASQVDPVSSAAAVVVPPEADVPTRVEALLDQAAGRGASDIHLDPQADGYAVRFRVDGLLEAVGSMPPSVGRAVVTRLMVMAGLLTYRLDIPQEGRLATRCASVDRVLAMRVSVIPTTQGLRAVLRLPAELHQPRTLADLELPEPALTGLEAFAAADAGMLLVVGPAGSGKTTTIYALLQHILQAQAGTSVVALEDPVERDLPGVTQVEVSADGQLDYARALRSILRQDPQVLMLGEIRDAPTASIAIEAALSGHRLIATMHAGGPQTAVARLLEMKIAPYQVAGALYGVLAQRLLRRRDPSGHGYRGRIPVAEFARVDDALRAAVVEHRPAPALRQILVSRGDYLTLAAAARRLEMAGLTDAAEIQRVLGSDPG